jgi:hypothetical protein
VKQSPIFVKSYDLMAWLIPRTLAFPKSQRGVLARQVQAQLFAFYEALVDAGLSEAPLPHLRRADASLTKLRAYLRLCRDLQLLSVRQYGYASQQVAEVGRLLGGWLKSLEGGTRPADRPRPRAVPAS